MYYCYCSDQLYYRCMYSDVDVCTFIWFCNWLCTLHTCIDKNDFFQNLPTLKPQFPVEHK